MAVTPREIGTSSRPGASPKTKLAAQVADRIVSDIVALGWPVGRVVGSEADLQARYEVSRAVFREAVRLVEHQQVARTRRGPGGGLVVTEPTIGAVTDAMVQYLQQVGARLDEVFEALIIVEEIASALAAGRSTEFDPSEFVVENATSGPGAEPGDFHLFVAAISGNACVELLVNVLRAVTLRYSTESGRSAVTLDKDASHEHGGIAEAIVAGDGAGAGHRMRKHLRDQADIVRRRRSTRQLLPSAPVLPRSVPGKGAEVVARDLNRVIVAGRLQPGQLVGTERELMERECVSRALLREAVRLLEHQQIARMRRGPGGGLFVMAPGPGAVTDMAAIYLARLGMSHVDVDECRRAVEGVAAALAAERCDGGGAAAMESALTWDTHAGDADWGRAADGFHASVAAAAENKVVHLIVMVLLGLSRGQHPERSAPKAYRRARAEALLAHQDIARAIESRDADAARERMVRHLGSHGVG